LILKEKKVYIPKDKKLRVEIIQLYHNILVARHRGKWKTIELVTRNYWLPKVTIDMRQYVERCNMCQRMENGTEIPVKKLKLSKIPKKP